MYCHDLNTADFFFFFKLCLHTWLLLQSIFYREFKSRPFLLFLYTGAVHLVAFFPSIKLQNGYAAEKMSPGPSLTRGGESQTAEISILAYSSFRLLSIRLLNQPRCRYVFPLVHRLRMAFTTGTRFLTPYPVTWNSRPLQPWPEAGKPVEGA